MSEPAIVLTKDQRRACMKLAESIAASLPRVIPDRRKYVIPLCEEIEDFLREQIAGVNASGATSGSVWE